MATWAPVIDLLGATGPTGPTGSTKPFTIFANVPYFQGSTVDLEKQVKIVPTEANVGEYVLVGFDTSENMTGMTGMTGSAFYQYQSDGTYKFVSPLSTQSLLTGPSGLAGPTGYASTATGGIGPTGYAGRSFTGPRGPAGISYLGHTGPDALYEGPTGSVGYTGYAGDILTGPTGDKGVTGPRGNNIYAIPYAPSSTTGPVQPQYPVVNGDLAIDMTTGIIWESSGVWGGDFSTRDVSGVITIAPITGAFPQTNTPVSSLSFTFSYSGGQSNIVYTVSSGVAGITEVRVNNNLLIPVAPMLAPMLGLDIQTQSSLDTTTTTTQPPSSYVINTNDLQNGVNTISLTLAAPTVVQTPSVSFTPQTVPTQTVDPVFIVTGSPDITGNTIIYSQDGTTWLNTTSGSTFSPNSGRNAICIFSATIAKEWVVVGELTNDKQCMIISANGVAWDNGIGSGISFFDKECTAIAYGGDAGSVAIGINKNLPTILRSGSFGTWNTATLTGGASISTQVNALHDVATSGSIWLVGGHGNSPQYCILRSLDGLTWSPTTSTLTSPGGTTLTNVTSIAYSGGTSRRWVCVGTDNLGNGQILYSINGSAWSTPLQLPTPVSTDVVWHKVLYANGIFVIVGSSNNPSISPIAYSLNYGALWTLYGTTNLSTTLSLVGLSYSSILNIWATVGNDNNVGVIYTFPGGVNNTALSGKPTLVGQGYPLLDSITSSTFLPGELFSTTTTSTTSTTSTTTTTTTTIPPPAPPLPLPSSIAPFVAGGYGIVADFDAPNSWIPVIDNTNSLSNAQIYGSAYAEGRGYIGVGTNGLILQSIDGYRWDNTRGANFGNVGGFGSAVAYGPTGGWVACGNDDNYNGLFLRSVDGNYWTGTVGGNAFSQQNAIPYGLAYGPVGGYIAVGADQNGNALIMRSPDGNYWTGTQVDNTNNLYYYDVAYGHTGGYVAVGQSNDGTALIMQSADGNYWTGTQVDNNTLVDASGIAYSPEKGWIVAATKGGGKQQPETTVLYSVNGQNWTTTNYPESGGYRKYGINAPPIASYGTYNNQKVFLVVDSPTDLGNSYCFISTNGNDWSVAPEISNYSNLSTTIQLAYTISGATDYPRFISGSMVQPSSSIANYQLAYNPTTQTWIGVGSSRSIIDNPYSLFRSNGQQIQSQSLWYPKFIRDYPDLQAITYLNNTNIWLTCGSPTNGINQIFRSTDDGNTWAGFTIPTVYKYFYTTVAANPDNSYIIASGYTSAPAGVSIMTVSRDGGNTWTDLGSTYPTYTSGNPFMPIGDFKGIQVPSSDISNYLYLNGVNKIVYVSQLNIWIAVGSIEGIGCGMFYSMNATPSIFDWVHLYLGAELIGQTIFDIVVNNVNENTPDAHAILYITSTAGSTSLRTCYKSSVITSLQTLKNTVLTDISSTLPSRFKIGDYGLSRVLVYPDHTGIMVSGQNVDKSTSIFMNDNGDGVTWSEVTKIFSQDFDIRCLYAGPSNWACIGDTLNGGTYECVFFGPYNQYANATPLVQDTTTTTTTPMNA
jgi:hypothetical protein